jgi:peptidoglycan/xylan/chitin deacetylase (PgdA/CDA1 family)
MYRSLVPRSTLGFLYHTLSAERLPHLRHLYAYKTPSMFECDVRFLRDNFDLPPVSDLFRVSQMQSASRRGRPCAFLTFDDGLAECYSAARQILLKDRVPCIFFVITDCIDNKRLMYRHKISLCLDRLLGSNDDDRQRKINNISAFLEGASVSLKDCVSRMRGLGFAEESTIDKICQALEIDVEGFLRAQRPYMTEEEIKQLFRDGFTIGAHTRRHPFLGDLAPEEIEAEIVESCRVVNSITGEKSIPFAFPYSGNKLNRSFLASLREKHPVVGPMFDTHDLQIDERFIINRIAVDAPPDPSHKGSDLPAVLRQKYCSFLINHRR